MKKLSVKNKMIMQASFGLFISVVIYVLAMIGCKSIEEGKDK